MPLVTSYRFEPDARSEYNQAIQYYFTEADEVVAANFIAEVESDIATICAAPGVWRVAKVPDVRRYVLRRFPFVIYYRYRSAENLVTIYALMHTSRQPGYWRGRLFEP